MKFIPKSADSYSRFMKILQIIVVLIAIGLLFFGVTSIYAHVDLCDTTDVVEKVYQEAKEKYWDRGWYERDGCWSDSPHDSGTVKDSPDNDR